ncbi:hypothetical protein B0H13DRAFT_1917838 [Mycena leptocephala]|nr:hypothetical protein B0H13DRAFT_1917838 [Mycena leptocephala]
MSQTVNLHPGLADLWISQKKFTHQLTSGLRFSHAQRILYHGLKPQNLLIAQSAQRDGESLKLADFGLTWASGSRCAQTDHGVAVENPPSQKTVVVRGDEIAFRDEVTRWIGEKGTGGMKVRSRSPQYEFPAEGAGGAKGPTGENRYHCGAFKRDPKGTHWGERYTASKGTSGCSRRRQSRGGSLTKVDVEARNPWCGALERDPLERTDAAALPSKGTQWVFTAGVKAVGRSRREKERRRGGGTYRAASTRSTPTADSQKGEVFDGLILPLYLSIDANFRLKGKYQPVEPVEDDADQEPPALVPKTRFPCHQVIAVMNARPTLVSPA